MEIAKVFNTGATEVDIATAVDSAAQSNTRLNVGVAGRGREELAPDQLSRLDRVLDLHGERPRALLDDPVPPR